MDIAQITDTQQLKALAYDQMLLLEQIQRNLAVIQARIGELQTDSDTPNKTMPAAPAK
jgi:hypothetical protein